MNNKEIKIENYYEKNSRMAIIIKDLNKVGFKLYETLTPLDADPMDNYWMMDNPYIKMTDEKEEIEKYLEIFYLGYKHKETSK